MTQDQGALKKLSTHRMDFPGCLSLPNVGNTFAGFDLAQAWQDLALWEVFLDRFPIASLIELGTWRGGMAVFLQLQATVRDFEFLTIDKVVHQDLAATKLPIRFEVMDLLGCEGMTLLLELIKPMDHPRAWFCDDGDKPAEVKLVRQLCHSGDMIIVHDWGAEIHQSDIDPGMEMVLERECLAVNSLTRFFVIA